MSYQATVFKVMIASPSDVEAERSIVRDLIIRWNNAHSDTRRIVLMSVGWDTHSTPAMGGRPQGILNKQILHDCDLLIGIFWTRIGTPTGEFASGTVEEVEEHVNQGKPAMLYFSNAPVRLDSVDQTQYAMLTEFKKGCQSRGIYDVYEDLAGFSEAVYRHLQIKLNSDPYFKVQEGITDQEAIVDAMPRAPKLTSEAAAILKAALPTGQILFVRAMNGTYLQTGGNNLIESSDPREIAKWQGALLELERANLVENPNGKKDVFRVTREGYEVGDTLV